MIFTIIGHNAVRVNMGAKWDKKPPLLYKFKNNGNFHASRAPICI